MPRKVLLTDEAIRQIAAIGDYIAQDSPAHALRWVQRLEERIRSLENSPERHAVLYTAEEAGREVRQTFFGAYRVLYEIQPDAVYVLTVRHGARKPLGPDEVAGGEHE